MSHSRSTAFTVKTKNKSHSKQQKRLKSKTKKLYTVSTITTVKIYIETLKLVSVLPRIS